MARARLGPARIARVRLPLPLLAGLAAFAIAVPAIGAAATPQTWNASVGQAGMNGMATLTATGTDGTLTVVLKALTPATVYPLQIMQGTCTKPGVALWAVPAPTSTGAGTITMSLAVPTAKLSAIRAAAAAGRLAIRVGAGSTVRCGVFTSRKATPAATPSPLPGVTAISAGGTEYLGHTCAVLADGTVRCWGDDSEGQLGDGTEWGSSTPVKVAGITTATAVATGAQFSCALLRDGSIWCWGSNYAGQLGNDTVNDHTSTPVRVLHLPPASIIAAGWDHVCAVVMDGIVRCWGSNEHGELGDGTTNSGLTPAVVSGVTSAARISAGPADSCAVLRDGTVRCWGQNEHGQLGDGTTTESHVPVVVSGITTATDVAVGDYHACALLADGSVRCWGSDSDGQIGDGIALTLGSSVDRLAPVPVTGLASAVSIGAGRYHACAVLRDGTIHCWGSGYWGELGDGEGQDSSVPVAARGITTASGVAAGGMWAGAHTCALLRDRTVRCWGKNVSGQLGDGTTIGRSSPVAVVAAPLPTPTLTSDTSAWVRVTSPWLGYSIALPGDRWRFYGHVDRTASQEPYDMYLGTVSPAGGDMELMIFCDRLEAEATPPPIRADVVADGVPITVTVPPLSEAGPTTFVSGGVKGDRVCSVMADTSNTEASQSFFRLFLTTFRFPPQGFVEQSPSPSPTPSPSD